MHGGYGDKMELYRPHATFRIIQLISQQIWMSSVAKVVYYYCCGVFYIYVKNGVYSRQLDTNHPLTQQPTYTARETMVNK